MNPGALIAHLLDNSMMAHDLPAGDQREAAQRIERMFTGCVDTLRNVDDEDVKSMGAYAWDVIHHRHVMTAIHPDVPTLTMAIIARGGIHQPVIFIPENWAEMVKDDPGRQFGAVCFVCSQAVDAYNEVKIDTIKERAMAYEGALLRMTGVADPDQWQKDALGLKPPAEYAYERKSVTAAQ
jgi:hypothetical protein